MAQIHILPEIVANKIAAGEVIERPASIVKELVENSLDAAADQLHVVVDHGGKSLIRVADNGLGMVREDAELALQRHATSKLQNAEDLESLHSFGFRGEALPSIAAVSRLVLKTRAEGEGVGTQITVEGGVTQSVEDYTGPVGTIIEVRDLFFNTPARRKFLKTDSTERSHISNVLANFALVKLDAHFTLQSGNKQLWDFLPGETLTNRAQRAFGLKKESDLLAFADEVPGVKLSGLIGKPQIAPRQPDGPSFIRQSPDRQKPRPELCLTRWLSWPVDAWPIPSRGHFCRSRPRTRRRQCPPNQARSPALE